MSQYRIIADEIAARIQSGHHAPGTLLPSPGDLEHLGHRLGDARDALRWLVRHGWAEIRPGTGYHVTEQPPQDEWEQFTRHVDGYLDGLRDS
ncbi:GntR family transcriptional regulator [Kineosporia succinea]|uniref:DNA-binding FadR family transcriptional regulator n=1 Tax=Kineosporia succinea TaxID=84632 RepID=A0ABT9PDU8_9ACTN|nr:GntR family transcriptional regulator [Kineosporia succinea]MDP9830883.1 DNA-binding FadR family transcriptional regulator [Kineosporia succinea]